MGPSGAGLRAAVQESQGLECSWPERARAPRRCRPPPWTWGPEAVGTGVVPSLLVDRLLVLPAPPTQETADRLCGEAALRRTFNSNSAER